MTDEQTLAQHVLQGLSAPQKALSSAWFYDDAGSRIFQRIMALPGYYLTRVEHDLCASAPTSWHSGSARTIIRSS